MIYVIADTHGDIDRLKGLKIRLKKNDFLIICGDFGFIWNGDKKEEKLIKKIGKCRCPILFVDGVHENFKLLKKYPLQEWNGGKTRVISGNLRYLERGQVFDLGGETVFALGGGWSGEDDALTDEENRSFAIPNDDDRNEALSNLKKHDNKVSFIISFEAPSKITEFLELSEPDRKHAGTLLDEIDGKADFKRWFFGRHHLNKIITAKYFAVYTKPVRCDIDIGLSALTTIKNTKSIT
ncbi:MAG: metallophosphoesterase [Eubacterium sp.]|jgi:hypothetical protein|nr:metallophosphoesterase [Eubacterium sp.]